MIDDLTLQGVTEPYRMLTARAEYRLSLRADNAETRLAHIAQAAGCVGDTRYRHQQRRAAVYGALRSRLDALLSAGEITAAGGRVALDGTRRSAWEWLRFPEVEAAHVGVAESEAAEIVAELVQDARYAPYVERQAAEVAALRREEGIGLPGSLDYAAIAGLSNEMVDRLSTSRPTTLGAASRIRGVTPAALSAVLLHVRARAA